MPQYEYVGDVPVYREKKSNDNDPIGGCLAVLFIMLCCCGGIGTCANTRPHYEAVEQGQQQEIENGTADNDLD